jgi:olfactory receptor
VGVIFFGVLLSGIIFSYTKIVSSIFKIPSTRGRYKAFSICGSHLSVVSLFYGIGFGVYMVPSVTDTSTKNVVASMMYTVVSPMLNPFIYSLKNEDMKGALRNVKVGIPFHLLCSLLGAGVSRVCQSDKNTGELRFLILPLLSYFNMTE